MPERERHVFEQFEHLRAVQEELEVIVQPPLHRRGAERTRGENVVWVEARDLLAGPPRVVNVGLEQFGEALRRQDAPVVHVDWRPPAGGDPRLVELLTRLTYARDREGDGQASVGGRVDEANRIAVRRLLDSRPVLVDVQPAGDALPGMAPNLVLHAGPPIAWEAMCALQRGAVAVGAVYEGLARDPEEAGRLVARGAIRLAPCHAHGAVGPMTGI